MRIMTLNAFHSRVVLIRLNTGNALPLTGRVGKAGMATEANLAAAVNHKLLRLFRVVKGGAVAVFTSDEAVHVFGAYLDFLAMTLPTKFMHLLFARITIFYRLTLPLFIIGFAMETVHETVFARTKIVRDIEKTEHENCRNKGYDHEQWSPYVTFHQASPFLISF
jgi:hypothetical protein